MSTEGNEELVRQVIKDRTGSAGGGPPKYVLGVTNIEGRATSSIILSERI
jgi:hypothetical protein